jgi:dolichyl-diphosphooligosaccharide--protein glycosyltransferase
VRLLPPQLISVPARAETLVRQKLAQREAAQLSPELAGEARRGAMQRAVDAWIADHRAQFDADVAAQSAQLRDALQYRDDAGRAYTFLGDYDSYTWMRAARNILRHGEPCDERLNGVCRDTFTLAPFGYPSPYLESLHVRAVVAVHRLLTWFDPQRPLPANMFVAGIVIALLAVPPAFAIGRRFAGPLGGFFAALISGLHPVFLLRTFGTDNDGWNVALPLYAMWGIVAALQATRRRGSVIAGALAGVAAAGHAALWRGWTFGAVVIAAGLAGALALYAAAWWWRRNDWRGWQAPGSRRVLATASAFAAALAVLLPFTAPGSLSQALRYLLPAAAWAAPAARIEWPSLFETVSELIAPSLGAIAAQSFGALIFLVGWFGMLLLLLPKRRWQAGHFAVLSASALLYRYLLTAAGLPRAVLVGLLSLPLLAALAVDLRDGDESDTDDLAAGLPVVAWLLGALLLSYQAQRFILLLAAPLGIACGVAVGRFYETLAAAAQTRPATRGPLARALLAAAVLALALEPLRLARATAENYLPGIDRAWVDTLTRLRDATPPDTIVFTWWDYGYWTKYFAERRVVADGGTLLTNVSPWLARAQLAGSEDESVGLLRMLACGSDAAPYPAKQHSARAALQRAGMDEVSAAAAIIELARLDRSAAVQYLTARGFDAAQRDEVLAATHCVPPPGVLLLTNAQIGLGGWWQVGAWEPARAAAVALQNQPESEAAASLATRLGLPPQNAAALARAARGLDAPARTRFIAPRGRLLTNDWIECPLTDGGERRCRVGLADSPNSTIDSIRYPADDPRLARVVRPAAANTRNEAPPDLLRVANRDLVETVTGAPQPDGVGVLIDADTHRALVGTPNAIASTYVQLLFLGGRGLTRFHKLDDRSGTWGRRIASWQIDWTER